MIRKLYFVTALFNTKSDKCLRVIPEIAIQLCNLLFSIRPHASGQVELLLQELDFEQYPDQHCIRCQEILRENGADERLIHAVCSHGYGITVDIPPEHEMEKVLYAVAELTGLIGAVALMRPSKSVQDLELKSVKKKYKSPSFAAGCSREVISQGAEMLGWSLDDLISRTIQAMRTLPEA